MGEFIEYNMYSSGSTIDWKYHDLFGSSGTSWLTKTRDTMDEVSVMMKLKQSETDPLALAYVNYLSSKYGFCGEIMVTGFAHYCQAILNLPCKDESYKINNDGIEWFKNNKNNIVEPFKFGK